MTTNTTLLTQLEFTSRDHKQAQALARHLGYAQMAYTSTSALVGLFCLPESPDHIKGRRCEKCQDRPGFDGLGRVCKACHGDGWLSRPHPGAPSRGGCVIKTRELGLLFVQCAEDMGFDGGAK